MRTVKINFPKDYKNYFTVADVERAKKVIKDFKENPIDFYDMASMAIYDIGGSVNEIYSVKAEVCRDAGTHDAYYEDSGNIDVWLDIVAETSDGFIKLGCLLSEIMFISSEDHLTRFNSRLYKRRA